MLGRGELPQPLAGQILLPGAEAGEEPPSRAGLPPPRLPPDVMAAHNEPGEKGGRRDAPPCLPRVLQGRGTLQGRKRGAFGAGPPSHPCLMGMAHLTGTSPQRAAGTLPRLQEHLRAWMEHIPAWGFRENLRDAGRKQGIVIGRGTGERGERLHLCCAPLGVLLSHNASSQWQGHPLPTGEGVQEGPQCKPRPLRGVPALLQDPAACPDELKPLTCLSPAG